MNRYVRSSLGWFSSGRSPSDKYCVIIEAGKSTVRLENARSEDITPPHDLHVSEVEERILNGSYVEVTEVDWNTYKESL